jgi:hypothetical protein
MKKNKKEDERTKKKTNKEQKKAKLVKTDKLARTEQ